MKRLIKIILLFTLILPIKAKSQQMHPDSLLNKMTGKWTLSGTIDGQETTHSIDAKRVLNKGYLQLNEISREMDKNGNPHYEAIVYISWQEKQKEYYCLWLDNTSSEGISNGIIGHAKQSKDKIEFVFKYNETTQFYTTFLYDRNTDTWQWFMDIDNNGKLQSFARVKLTREPNK